MRKDWKISARDGDWDETPWMIMAALATVAEEILTRPKTETVLPSPSPIRHRPNKVFRVPCQSDPVKADRTPFRLPDPMNSVQPAINALRANARTVVNKPYVENVGRSLPADYYGARPSLPYGGEAVGPVPPPPGWPEEVPRRLIGQVDYGGQAPPVGKPGWPMGYGNIGYGSSTVGPVMTQSSRLPARSVPPVAAEAPKRVRKLSPEAYRYKWNKLRDVFDHEFGPENNVIRLHDALAEMGRPSLAPPKPVEMLQGQISYSDALQEGWSVNPPWDGPVNIEHGIFGEGYYSIGNDEAYQSRYYLQMEQLARLYWAKTGKSMPFSFPKGIYTEEKVLIAAPGLDPNQHDVTQKVYTFIDSIYQQIDADLAQNNDPYKILWKIKDNFSNGGEWDSQGTPGFPGQVLSRTQDGKIQYQENGKIETTDQVAVLNGSPVRAGYISNYIFGAAMAHIGFSKEWSLEIAQFIAWIGNLKRIIQSDGSIHPEAVTGDNPRDQEAISDGWDYGVRRGVNGDMYQFIDRIIVKYHTFINFLIEILLAYIKFHKKFPTFYPPRPPFP